MRGFIQRDWVTIGLMGMLLLLAAAVGRATANNVSHRLLAPPAHAEPAGMDARAALDAAAVTDWLKR